MSLECVPALSLSVHMENGNQQPFCPSWSQIKLFLNFFVAEGMQLWVCLARKQTQKCLLCWVIYRNVWGWVFLAVVPFFMIFSILSSAHVSRSHRLRDLCWVCPLGCPTGLVQIQWWRPSCVCSGWVCCLPKAQHLSIYLYPSIYSTAFRWLPVSVECLPPVAHPWKETSGIVLGFLMWKAETAKLWFCFSGWKVKLMSVGTPACVTWPNQLGILAEVSTVTCCIY